MRRLTERMAAHRWVGAVGLVMATALVVVTLGSLGFGSPVLASHDDATTIHACVNKRSYNLVKIAPPGVEADCRPNDVLVEWSDASGTDALEARIAVLEEADEAQQATIDTLTSQVSTLESAIDTLTARIDSLDTQVPDCLSESSGVALFTGCNLQVVSGAGTTGGGQTNKAGNEAASVSGGQANQATGQLSSVTGGHNNTASGEYASVSGGADRTAPVGDNWAAGSLQEQH